MKLVDPWFEATFYGDATATSHHRLPSIEGAQGVLFYCPCCYGKSYHAHMVMVPFANPRNAAALPPDHGPTARGNPNLHLRWKMSGTGLHDLTLTPSVDVGEPACWHGCIQNGDIT